MGRANAVDLIEHVVTSAAEVPLLWLLLGRPELLDRQAGWSNRGARGTVLSLAPLTDHESSALVASLAAGTLENEERDLLLATAEGNPFFLEQLVASRAESGRAPASPPPTIQALLAARIDALPATEREVVDRAAIEGRNFHRSGVAALLPASARNRLDGVLQALERRDLIRPGDSELPDETAYRFAHTLVRDVAYELSPKARRAEFHEAYAGWLEERPGGA